MKKIAPIVLICCVIQAFAQPAPVVLRKNLDSATYSNNYKQYWYTGAATIYWTDTNLTCRSVNHQYVSLYIPFFGKYAEEIKGCPDTSRKMYEAHFKDGYVDINYPITAWYANGTVAEIITWDSLWRECYTMYYETGEIMSIKEDTSIEGYAIPLQVIYSYNKTGRLIYESIWASDDLILWDMEWDENGNLIHGK